MFAFITSMFNGDAEHSTPKKRHPSTNGKVHHDEWQETIREAQDKAVEEMERGNRDVNDYLRLLNGGASRKEKQRERSK